MNRLMNWLPVGGAVAAAAGTLGALWYAGQARGGSNPLTDFILGPSEVFAWVFIHGDNAESLMQLYRAGLPFGLAFNMGAGFLAGWLLRRACRLRRRRS